MKCGKSGNRYKKCGKNNAQPCMDEILERTTHSHVSLSIISFSFPGASHLTPHPLYSYLIGVFVHALLQSCMNA